MGSYIEDMSTEEQFWHEKERREQAEQKRKERAELKRREIAMQKAMEKAGGHVHKAKITINTKSQGTIEHEEAKEYVRLLIEKLKGDAYKGLVTRYRRSEKYKKLHEDITTNAKHDAEDTRIMTLICKKAESNAYAILHKKCSDNSESVLATKIIQGKVSAYNAKIRREHYQSLRKQRELRRQAALKEKLKNVREDILGSRSNETRNGGAENWDNDNTKKKKNEPRHNTNDRLHGKLERMTIVYLHNKGLLEDSTTNKAATIVEKQGEKIEELINASFEIDRKLATKSICEALAHLNIDNPSVLVELETIASETFDNLRNAVSARVTNSKLSQDIYEALINVAFKAVCDIVALKEVDTCHATNMLPINAKHKNYVKEVQNLRQITLFAATLPITLLVYLAFRKSRPKYDEGKIIFASRYELEDAKIAATHVSRWRNLETLDCTEPANHLRFMATDEKTVITFAHIYGEAIRYSRRAVSTTDSWQLVETLVKNSRTPKGKGYHCERDRMILKMKPIDIDYDPCTHLTQERYAPHQLLTHLRNFLILADKAEARIWENFPAHELRYKNGALYLDIEIPSRYMQLHKHSEQDLTQCAKWMAPSFYWAMFYTECVLDMPGSSYRLWAREKTDLARSFKRSEYFTTIQKKLDELEKERKDKYNERWERFKEKRQQAREEAKNNEKEEEEDITEGSLDSEGDSVGTI